MAPRKTLKMSHTKKMSPIRLSKLLKEGDAPCCWAILHGRNSSCWFDCNFVMLFSIRKHAAGAKATKRAQEGKVKESLELSYSIPKASASLAAILQSQQPGTQQNYSTTKIWHSKTTSLHSFSSKGGLDRDSKCFKANRIFYSRNQHFFVRLHTIWVMKGWIWSYQHSLLESHTKNMSLACRQQMAWPDSATAWGAGLAGHQWPEIVLCWIFGSTRSCRKHLRRCCHCRQLLWPDLPRLKQPNQVSEAMIPSENCLCRQLSGNPYSVQLNLDAANIGLHETVALLWWLNGSVHAPNNQSCVKFASHFYCYCVWSSWNQQRVRVKAMFACSVRCTYYISRVTADLRRGQWEIRWE